MNRTSKYTLLILVTLSIFFGKVNGQNIWINDIVQSVSGDTIFSTIADLQPMDRISFSNCTIPQQYLKNRLHQYNLDTVFYHYFLADIPPNVIGIKYGRVDPNEKWIMGAHYDAVVAGAGADDNASGTAAVIEMARVTKDINLEKTLILILFSAEEVGLWGSQAFVDSSLNEISIEGMINLDMIAYSHNLTDSAVSVCYKDFCISFLQKYETATSLYVPELTVEPDSSSLLLYASDHAPFWAKGIPALFLIENSDRFGGSFNPYYHLPSDTIGTGANSKWLAEKITRSAVATLLSITKPYQCIAISEDKPALNIINIYPNPADQFININIDNIDDQSFEIKIHDLSGRLVRFSNERSGVPIDISELTKGYYIINITHSGTSTMHKFLKL